MPVIINHDGPFSGQTRLVGSRWTMMRGCRVVQLDTATGALVADETWPSAVPENGAQLYDGESETLLVRTDAGWTRLLLNRGGGAGQELADIVTSLCGRAGLAAADIEASELDDTVPGFVIGRQTTVRDALEPLLQAYAADAVESDDRLVFRKRGRAPVATIPADLLVPLDASHRRELARAARPGGRAARAGHRSLSGQGRRLSAGQPERQAGRPDHGLA